MTSFSIQRWFREKKKGHSGETGERKIPRSDTTYPSVQRRVLKHHLPGSSISVVKHNLEEKHASFFNPHLLSIFFEISPGERHEEHRFPLWYSRFLWRHRQVRRHRTDIALTTSSWNQWKRNKPECHPAGHRSSRLVCVDVVERNETSHDRTSHNHETEDNHRVSTPKTRESFLRSRRTDWKFLLDEVSEGRAPFYRDGLQTERRSSNKYR